jgi:carboxypeptidase Q
MGNGLEVDYTAKPGAVKDKLAFIYIGILDGSPEGSKNLHRSEKTELAIKNGAKGVVIYNQVDSGVLLTGTASVTGALLNIPAVCIGKEVGTELKEKLKTKKVTAHITMTNKSDMIKARNVIATLKGSELPDERILIGGHLDSWDLATGAIDNGIGSFSVLDIARSFKANNLQPKRTVQFIMFMGEEQGLLGSTWMAEKEAKDGTIENIKYMMNLDMTGNPTGINAGGKIDDSTFFKTVSSELMAIDTIFKGKVTNHSGLHSDHQPFMLEGVPVLGLNGNLDRSVYRCYHSDCDLFDLVNRDHLTNTVRFGTMVLYALANADTLPAKKMDSETTKQFMIDNNLKEPLIIAGDWKWEK